MPDHAQGTEPTALEDSTFVADSRILDALREGDEAAFRDLVGRYHASLLRLAALYVQDPAAAEEVVQETWLGVLRGVGAFEGRSSLKTWIFRILVNRAKTRAQRGKRSLPFSAFGESDEAEGAVDRLSLGSLRPGGTGWLSTPRWGDAPEDVVLGEEVADRVHEVLEGLPPSQRVVLTLRDIEGWSSEDVCMLLEISEANQRVLLHRARARLRRALATDRE